LTGDHQGEIETGTISDQNTRWQVEMGDMEADDQQTWGMDFKPHLGPTARFAVATFLAAAALVAFPVLADEPRDVPNAMR
jgi:hypothetical protein